MPPKRKAAGGAAKGGKKAKKEEPAAPQTMKDAAEALKAEDKNIYDFSYIVSDSGLSIYGFFCDLNKNELGAFKHYGQWQCMDTVREKKLLNKIYKENKFYFFT